MSPLRLLILGILGYLLFRLMFGKKPAKNRAARRSSNVPARDVLVEDPVCKTYVPRGQAVQLKKRGKEFFFCSEECREKFLSEKEGGRE